MNVFGTLILCYCGEAGDKSRVPLLCFLFCHINFFLNGPFEKWN
jgi:hypothetical protein